MAGRRGTLLLARLLSVAVVVAKWSFRGRERCNVVGSEYIGSSGDGSGF